MERIDLDGLELQYELRGSGAPVVLVHWGVSADWAAPLLDAPALRGYLLLSYQRAGFGRSGRAPDPVTLADHAEHCRRLMRALDIDPAHIVGHSSSAAIALQLALDAPDAVRTLVLMDAARPAPSTAAQADFAQTFVAPAIARYREGDREGAVDTFLRGVFGPDYRDPLEAGLPGGFKAAVAEADAFFGQELPALQRWTFTEREASRVTQPVLAVVGEHSAATFHERRELLLAWLPDVTPLELAGARHLLHVEQPDRMAEALATFFRAH